MDLNLINNGMARMAAQQLGENQKMQGRSMARLSSGTRHVHPNEDAGGLAVSMKLGATNTRNKRVMENASNALSFLQVQHGAMEHVSELLDRMSELKTMALDPTKNAGDLANYKAEFSELQKEAASALEQQFNGVALFSNAFTDLYLPLSERGLSTAVIYPQEQIDTITNIQGDPTQFQQDTIGGLAGSDPKAQMDTIQGFSGDSTVAQVDTVSGIAGSPAVKQVDTLKGLVGSPGVAQVDTLSGLAGSASQAQVDTITGIAGDDTETFHVETVTLNAGSGAVAQVDRISGLVGDNSFSAQTDTISGLAGGPGDTYTVTVNGSSQTVGWATDVDTTLNAIVSAVNSDGSMNSVVTARKVGSTVELEGATMGATFTATAVTNNFSGGGTISNATTTGAALPDVMRVRIAGVNIQTDWNLDAPTTAGDLVGKIMSNGSLAALLTATVDGNDVLLTGKTPGTPFLTQVSTTENGTVPTAAISVATDRANAAADTFSIDIDGTMVTASWDTDAATTAQALATAINGNGTISAKVSAAASGSDIVITGKTFGEQFVTTTSKTGATANLSNTTTTEGYVKDTFKVTVDGVALDVEFDTDAGTTANAIANAVNANGTLAAKVTAARSGNNVEITANSAGTAFSATVAGTDNGNGPAAAISSSTTTANAVDDAFSATVNGTSVSVQWQGDAASTAQSLADALNGNGSISSAVTASLSGSDVEITSDVAGVAFTSSASATDNGQGATANLISNTTSANALADTYDIDVDGTSVNVVWNTDAATTAQAIVNALNGNAAIAAKLTATLSGTEVVLESTVAGSGFTTTLTANENGAGATAALTKEATTANAVADIFEITIDGTAIRLDWDTDTATTAANLAAAINAHATLGGLVDAVATADGFTLTAKSPGTPFTAASDVTDNSSGAVAAMNLATTTPNVVGDTFDISVDGNVVQSKFITDAATTAQFMADDINNNAGTSAVVTAAAVGSTVTLTAKTPGTPFTATAQANENGGTAAANIASSNTEPNMPGDTFDIAVDALSLNVGWDTDAATTAQAIASAVNANPAFSSIVLAEAVGDDVTLTVQDGRNTFTSGITPVEDGFQAQAAGTVLTAIEPLGDRLKVSVDGTSVTVEVDNDMTVTAASLADAINLNLASQNAMAVAEGVDLKLTARVPGVPFTAVMTGIDGTMGSIPAGGNRTPVQGNIGFDANGSVVVPISRHDIFLSGPGNGLQNTANQSLLDSSNDMDSFSIEDLGRFMETLSISAAENGAVQQRIGQSLGLLHYNHAHTEQARSRLEDVNLATEATALARWNLLVEGLPGLMAQANALPGLALNLIL